MKLMGTPEEKEKLVDAIKLFYDNVMEQKDIRHFFFGMTTDKLVKDIRKLTQMVNKLKIETSISLRMRDEEVEIHGKSNCWDIGRR